MSTGPQPKLDLVHSSITAADFADEVDEIRRYSDCVRRRTVVRRSDVKTLLSTLRQRKRIRQQPYAVENSRRGLCDLGELQDIIEMSDALIEDMYKYVAQPACDLGIEPFDEPAELSSLDRYQWELVLHFAGFIQDSEGAVWLDQAMLEEVRCTIVANNAERSSDPDGVQYDPDECIDLIETCAPYVVWEERTQDLRWGIEFLEDLSLMARLSDPRSALHLARQAFIALMATFDAALFDLVRHALTADFYGLAEHFVGKLTIDRSELALYASDEDFRVDQVNKILRAKYLKELLHDLRDMGLQLTEASADHSFGHLVELVLRRNCHLHCRGIVDDQYLGFGKAGSCNPYTLNKGDRLDIDEDYVHQACELCEHCVQVVANWADSLQDGKRPQPRVGR